MRTFRYISTKSLSSIVLINSSKRSLHHRPFFKNFPKKKKTRTYRDIKSNEKIDITGKLPTTILMQFFNLLILASRLKFIWIIEARLYFKTIGKETDAFLQLRKG